MRQSTASLQSRTNTSLSTEVTPPPRTSDEQQRGSFSGGIKHFWVESIALTPQQRREVHHIFTFSGENLFFLIVETRGKGERMTQHPAQAALASCVLAVFVFSHVSIRLRMCVLDGDGGGLGSIKRRCFQSDRGSSVFTHRLFKRLTFLPNVSLLRAPRKPCAKLTSSRRLLFVYGGGEDFRATAELGCTCSCSCHDVKDREDLKHIFCCCGVML